MADEWLKKTTRPVKVAQIDTTAPNVARVWNYLVGGRDNFEADRKAARQLISIAPIMTEAGQATRAFRWRAIRLLAEAGIRQFLDIGTGLPTADNAHDIAQVMEPGSRLVFVDNDPVVLAHARALLTPTPGGATSYIDADAREPGKIVAEARTTLDFGEPVAVILIDLLNFIGEPGMTGEIVTTLMGAVPPGSYLVVVHPANDLDPSLLAAAQRWNQISPTPVTLRSRAEVSAWADGLELIEPGVVQVTQWRPDEPPADDPPAGEPPADELPADDPAPPERVMPFYGFIARKP